MKEFTQTALAPVGNCWQTAVACVLGVEPAELPDQATLDRKLVDGEWRGMGYNNPLRAYLLKHHGLAHVDMHAPAEALALLSVRPDVYHLITGRTVRTDERGIRHCVVGRGGEVVWDPHPSRAGLTDDIRWAFLVPYPKEWTGYRKDEDGCLCPACAAERA